MNNNIFQILKYIVLLLVFSDVLFANLKLKKLSKVIDTRKKFKKDMLLFKKMIISVDGGKSGHFYVNNFGESINGNFYLSLLSLNKDDNTLEILNGKNKEQVILELRNSRQRINEKIIYLYKQLESIREEREKEDVLRDIEELKEQEQSVGWIIYYLAGKYN